jgi:SAM-dependent methyltransferase
MDGPQPILECTRCGTIYFARPIIQPHDYETYYPYLLGFDHERFKWELDQRRKRFLFQLQEIARLDPPGRTLTDIGAGVGYFCAAANQGGWQASGVDASVPATEAGRREFGVQYSTLDAVPDGTCAVVTAFHVLEHLEAPSSVLKIIRKKLAPRGVLVVHVPNRESLSAYLRYKLSRLLTGAQNRRGSLYYPEHVTGFTSAGLALCADAAGFDLVRSRQGSPFSRFHDAWLIRSYFDDLRINLWSGGTVQLARKLANALIDTSGELMGRGDWLIAHFRAR